MRLILVKFIFPSCPVAHGHAYMYTRFIADGLHFRMHTAGEIFRINYRLRSTGGLRVVYLIYISFLVYIRLRG